MKFLIDNQLPPALARFICEELHTEALHVEDAGLQTASDEAVWQYASRNEFVLITKDEDFLTLHAKTPSARLLWVRVGNCRRTFLLNVFKKEWSRIVERYENGERFVELR